MSGHSKWANIKHKKARGDAAKGNIFSKMAKEIIVAARHGGGNPDGNFRLAAAIAEARKNNVPWDNIQRAIKRGTGELDGTILEELTYEGYGPAGVAVLVDCMTDNRNRTAGDVRYIFSKNGGNLGESGSVAWQFKKRGYITVERESGINEDDLMMLVLDAGAEDMESGDDTMFEIYTNPDDLYVVRQFLEGKQVKVSSSEITMVPSVTVQVAGKEADLILKMMESLEEHEDVQKVYANFDMSDEELARHEA
jgi:YebC/PmpR family DNA-binding regulatory protein